MVIDWPSLILGASPLAFGLALRFLLDMHLWPCLIKYLSWAPVRGIFRTNPANLRGEWDLYWESKSEKFSSDIQRKNSKNIPVGWLLLCNLRCRGPTLLHDRKDRRFIFDWCLAQFKECEWLSGILPATNREPA